MANAGESESMSQADDSAASHSRASDLSQSYHEDASTRGSRTRTKGSRTQEGKIRRVCAFWLGSTLYALDVRVVRRIIPIQDAVPVPKTDPCVVGLQIQRGSAVTLINAVGLLGLREAFDPDKCGTALVVEADNLYFGIVIDRIESVVNAPTETFRRRTSDAEPEVIAGVYEALGDPPQPATLLDTDYILARVNQLRFKKTS